MTPIGPGSRGHVVLFSLFDINSDLGHVATCELQDWFFLLVRKVFPFFFLFFVRIHQLLLLFLLLFLSFPFFSLSKFSLQEGKRMHGVKREKYTEAVLKARKQAELEKMAEYQSLNDKIIQLVCGPSPDFLSPSSCLISSSSTTTITCRGPRVTCLMRLSLSLSCF